jgi:hypothetical protein
MGVGSRGSCHSFALDFRESGLCEAEHKQNISTAKPPKRDVYVLI